MNTEVTKQRVPLPPVVFGATSLGNLFREIHDAEKHDIVAEWIKTGLSPTVIDSAGKYGAGLSLEVIGRELESLGVSPEQVIISNKLGWRRTPLKTPEPTFEPGAWFGIKYDAVQDISYEGIVRCWKEGNELLRPYRAQLLSVHDPDEYLAAATDASDRNRRLADITSAHRALAEIRDSGEALATGVGAKDWRVIKELDRECDFDWVMFANSFTLMNHPPELIEFIADLASRGISVINSAVFHGGFLLGGGFLDYHELDPNSESDRKAIRWRNSFQAACTEYDVLPFNVGVAFGRSHPGIQAIALSSSRADRVATHVESIYASIPEGFWDELKDRQLLDREYPFV